MHRKKQDAREQIAREARQHQAGRYLISLIRCALHEKEPEKKPEGCSWEQLYLLAQRNSVENTCSPAIEKYPHEIPEVLAEKWKRSIYHTLNRILRFEVEREQIEKEMEKKGISYLPLKGILLAEYYPQPGMRWMCDNDILYGYLSEGEDGKPEVEKDSEQRAERDLKKIMLQLGYTAEQLGGNHDVYQKKPFFNFEMHRRLFSSDSVFADYYRNPWEKAVRDSKNACACHWRAEDEYLFMLAHAYKHFSYSGCGIRTLVDEYVFLQKKQEMDWNYLAAELKKMGMEDFENQMRKIALHAFSEDGVLESKEWEQIFFMLGCGTYGTSKNRIERELQELERENPGKNRSLLLHYLRKRLWLSEENLKAYYPFFYRHKWSRWIVFLYRIVRGLLFRSARLFGEWQIVLGFLKKRKEEERE